MILPHRHKKHREEERVGMKKKVGGESFPRKTRSAKGVASYPTRGKTKVRLK